MPTKYAYTLTSPDNTVIGPVVEDDYGPFYGVSDALNGAWKELFGSFHLDADELSDSEIDITNTVYQYPIEVEVGGWLVRADMAHCFDN